jgi:arylsulfatase A-like enzyme
MTDDVGFAASSTFGGAIPTPTFDRHAADDLRYNNFHTTALCSPTRAALLTGRNHHACRLRQRGRPARGEPGYNSILPKSAGTIGQILSAAGYDAAWFGKNHNVPTWQSGPLGPFDQWASVLGFRYFYGFNRG